MTDKDRKVLKYQKRPGFVFSGFVIAFGGLFNLIYFVLNRTEQDYLMVSLIDLGILLLAYFICNRINLKVNKDLKENIKEIQKRKVDKKIEEKSYEAGSGALYIPILGDLFPKLWGQKMKETGRYLIFSGEDKFEVEKGVYNDLRKGSDFCVHFAKYSETVLYFSKDE